MFEGGDPGFCGPSYQAPMVLQDAQDAINWYLEHDPEEHAKEPVAMLGAPGLNALVTAGIFAPVRGMWVLPGGSTAIYVAGAAVYKLSSGFVATQVGTLLTNTGPVSIRDNGVLTNGLGGYVVIVDGTYGYYYLIAGATYSLTFAGAVQASSSTITFPGSLPNGLVISSTATISGTGIPHGTQIIAIDTIGLTATMTLNAIATDAALIMTMTIPAFGQITDEGFLGANRVAFIEGWLIFNRPGTRTFYTTGPTPYQMLFPGAFFALKDSSTDNLVTLEENNRELWLIGERTSEVWYNAGNPNFAFARIPGVGPQIGCAAFASITRLGNQLVWLGDNEQGENIVVVQSQYSWERISNHAIEHAISTYSQISDAVGFAYEEEGHLFYMLAFPSADNGQGVTWCFDATTKQWHKRLYWFNGAFSRHRSNCFMNFQNKRVVGDYENGDIYEMNRSFYTDNGQTLRALRRAPHIWQKANRGRIFYSQLQVEFTPGVGQQTDPDHVGASHPEAMLRWSDDGGFTWSNEQWSPIGKAGETRNRAIWYLLGESRDRVWEVSFTAPVPRDVIGATCFVEAAAA